MQLMFFFKLIIEVRLFLDGFRIEVQKNRAIGGFLVRGLLYL